MKAAKSEALLKNYRSSPTPQREPKPAGTILLETPKTETPRPDLFGLPRIALLWHGSGIRLLLSGRTQQGVEGSGVADCSEAAVTAEESAMLVASGTFSGWRPVGFSWARFGESPMCSLKWRLEGRMSRRS